MGRPPIGKAAMTSAERVRRYRDRVRNVTESVTEPRVTESVTERALETRIRGLEADLAAARARIRELADEALAQAQSFRDEWARRAAKPKAEKAPLPPDEERDRQIKALKTANHNLRVKVNSLKAHYDKSIALVGGMSFVTQSAIAKCLHPDYTPSEAERADACRLFNAWKSDKDRAKRGTR